MVGEIPKSMCAIFSMSMAAGAAHPVVQVMCCYNGNYRRNQQPYMQRMPDLLGQQQQYTKAEQRKWQYTVVVFAETMTQRINAHQKRHCNHSIFKKSILYNIKAKYGQTG